MEPKTKQIEHIMIKYLENKATEAESLLLMDFLDISDEMRLKLNFIASGLNRMKNKNIAK